MAFLFYINHVTFQNHKFIAIIDLKRGFTLANIALFYQKIIVVHEFNVKVLAANEKSLEVVDKLLD